MDVFKVYLDHLVDHQDQEEDPMVLDVEVMYLKVNLIEYIREEGNIRMELYKECRLAKINDNVTHQNIGGKTISLDRELSLEETLETNTIAASNFMARRMDLVTKGIVSESDINSIIEGKTTLDEFNKKADDFYKNTKVYYGHVGNLGYFVCEDEIKFIEEGVI